MLNDSCLTLIEPRHLNEERFQTSLNSQHCIAPFYSDMTCSLAYDKLSLTNIVKYYVFFCNLLDLTRVNIEVILGVVDEDFTRQTLTGKEPSSKIRS